jgi:hypothetical protein
VIIRATTRGHGSQVRIDCQRTTINVTLAMDQQADRHVQIINDDLTAMANGKEPIVATVPVSGMDAFGVAVMTPWPVATYMKPTRGGLIGPLPYGIIAYRFNVGSWDIPCFHDEGLEPTIITIHGADGANGYKPVVAPANAPQSVIVPIQAPEQGWYQLKVPVGIASMTWPQPGGSITVEPHEREVFLQGTGQAIIPFLAHDNKIIVLSVTGGGEPGEGFSP